MWIYVLHLGKTNMFPLLSTASSIPFRRLLFFFFCFAVASQNLLYTSYRMISHLNHLESRMKCEPIDGFGVGRSTLYRRQICISKVHIEIVDICKERETFSCSRLIHSTAIHLLVDWACRRNPERIERPRVDPYSAYVGKWRDGCYSMEIGHLFTPVAPCTH